MMLERTKSSATHKQPARCKTALATLALLLSTTLGKSPLKQDTVVTADYPEIWEQDVVSGFSLGDKTWGYFQMTISERYFTGVESLAIRVIADSYNSDPDLFISRVS